MSDLDPNPTLRTEFNAALASIEPQIRGLADLSHIPPSTELGKVISEKVEKLTRRHELIVQAITALDEVVQARMNLESDGYPVIEEVQIPDNLFLELKAEVSDVEVAALLFTPMATKVNIRLGIPSDKLEGS